MSTFTPNFDGTCRRCLFDHKDNVTVVQSAKRQGPLATTFQSNERNVSYTLKATLKDRVIDSRSYIHEGVKFEGEWLNGSPMSCGIIKDKITKIPIDVLEYLMGKGNGLLPAGYGWDGIHTNFELTRVGKIKQLIIGQSVFKNITQETIDVITKSIMGAKNENLMMDWNKALPFSKAIYPQTMNTDSKLFVFAQNNDLSVMLDIEDDVASIEIPLEYNRCVVVVTKYLSSTTHPSYGASVELYERNVENVKK